jgi:uncharacterized BrkB/YihY/UPF0761 family membrane protein
MDKYSVPHPERESYVKHRRDVTRQIILPVVLVTLAGIGAALLAGFASAGNNPGVSMWADISIIWLIIPMMALALVILALMLALVYGLNHLLKISPHYTGLAQTYALWLNAQVTIWTDEIMQPLLSIKTWLDLIMKRKE